MSNIDTLEHLKSREVARKQAQEKINTQFVLNSYPTVTITNLSGQIKTASVVNKQESDIAYFYVEKKDSLNAGEIWKAKTLSFIISEEIVIIKDVGWKKYLAYKCNFNVDNLYGYFIGPEKSHIDLEIKQNMLLNSKQKPLIVLPSGSLSFKDKIVIGGRAWIVDEYDAISTPGITYYSLLTSTVSSNNTNGIEKNSDIVINVPSTSASDSNIIHPDVETTLTTEDGYFRASTPLLKILTHSTTSVTFTVPFGVDNVSIEIKQKGAIVKTDYSVLV